MSSMSAFLSLRCSPISERGGFPLTLSTLLVIPTECFTAAQFPNSIHGYMLVALYTLVETPLYAIMESSSISTILKRTVEFLLSESRNPGTRHLLHCLDGHSSSTQLQLMRQLLCVRVPYPELPEDVLQDIEDILFHERNRRVQMPVSLPAPNDEGYRMLIIYCCSLDQWHSMCGRRSPRK